MGDLPCTMLTKLLVEFIGQLSSSRCKYHIENSTVLLASHGSFRRNALNGAVARQESLRFTAEETLSIKERFPYSSVGKFSAFDGEHRMPCNWSGVWPG